MIVMCRLSNNDLVSFLNHLEINLNQDVIRKVLLERF